MRKKKSCSLLLESANFLISPFKKTFSFLNKAIKMLSSASDNAGDVKFLVQYFGHTKKGKHWGFEN